MQPVGLVSTRFLTDCALKPYGTHITNNHNLLTIIYALTSVHLNLFIFHTILNIYYHSNKIQNSKFYIVVVCVDV